MKRSVLSLLCACDALAFFVSTARAELFDYDPFAYVGTALDGQSGGTGWSGAWTNTTTTGDTLSNDGVSLSNPASFQPPLAAAGSSGSRVITGGISGSSSRLLSQSVNLSLDGTVRYASALFRKNTPNGTVTTDNILLEFVDATGNRRWGFGIEGAGDKPWLNANGSITPGGPSVTVGDPYFLVAKIVSSASGLDTAFLKVFGTGYDAQVPFAEPTIWDATLTETTAANLDRIRIRIDAGNAVGTPGEVDEIRIGTTWADVVSVPEPSSATLLGLPFLAAIARRRR
jgi:hypothetical protein